MFTIMVLDHVQRPGTHFTIILSADKSKYFEMFRVLFVFDYGQMILSDQKFVHVTSTQLPWYNQNCDQIWFFFIIYAQSDFVL